MVKEYKGKIRLNTLLNDITNMGSFRTKSIQVTQSLWSYDETNKEYHYVMAGYEDPIIIDIFDIVTKKTVLIDVDMTNEDEPKLISISNAPIGVTFLYRTDASAGADEDFYPISKASLIFFADGKDLETKYINGELDEFSQDQLQDDDYVKKVTASMFIENIDKRVIVIPGTEHKLGSALIVEGVLKIANNKLEQIRPETILIDIVPAGESADVTMTFSSAFDGYIVLKRKDWPLD